MTKKDYIVIADTLKKVKYSLLGRPQNEFLDGQKYCLNYIIDELCYSLYKQNNSFDDDKFKKAIKS